MQSFSYISPADERGGKGGGGPDDPTRVGQVFTRSQGFLMLAFGIALGLTFMIFFAVFHKFRGLIYQFTDLKTFVNDFSNIWISFVVGFVGGMVLSAIYNILVVRRLNLSGLESSSD